MRQTRIMLFGVAVLTMGLASFAVAQMMNGNHDHPSKGKGDSASHSGMMGNMSENCEMMLGNFDELEEHFEKMMLIQDMDALKAEMQIHRDKMKKIHSNMLKQHSMCQDMMSKMHSNGKHGMMGADSSDAGSSGQHDHNH